MAKAPSRSNTLRDYARVADAGAKSRVGNDGYRRCIFLATYDRARDYCCGISVSALEHPLCVEDNSQRHDKEKAMTEQEVPEYTFRERVLGAILSFVIYVVLFVGATLLMWVALSTDSDKKLWPLIVWAVFLAGLVSLISWTTPTWEPRLIRSMRRKQ